MFATHFAENIANASLSGLRRGLQNAVESLYRQGRDLPPHG
jgi:hypothetical protein